MRKIQSVTSAFISHARQLNATVRGEIWAKCLVFACFAATFALISSKALEKSQTILGDYTSSDCLDPGLNWLWGAWLQVICWWHPKHQSCGGDLFAFESAVMCVFALLVLLPRLPLLISIGGEVMVLLLLWRMFGELGARTHLIEAWDVALGAVFITSLCFWKGTARDYFTAILFGAVLGYFPLMRQSAVQTSAACLLMIGVGLVAAAASLWRTAGGLRPIGESLEIPKRNGRWLAAAVKQEWD